MAGYLVEDQRKVTTHRLIQMKAEGKKIAMLTSYDYTTATITARAGIDVILVGDSASNVMAGNWTTLPIYINTVLENWRKKGYKTVADIVDGEKTAPKQTKQGKNNFAAYDLDAFEKMLNSD